MRCSFSGWFLDLTRLEGKLFQPAKSSDCFEWPWRPGPLCASGQSSHLHHLSLPVTPPLLGYWSYMWLSVPAFSWAQFLCPQEGRVTQVCPLASWCLSSPLPTARSLPQKKQFLPLLLIQASYEHGEASRTPAFCLNGNIAWCKH